MHHLLAIDSDEFEIATLRRPLASGVSDNFAPVFQIWIGES
jgi:hypothetical protein